MKSIDIKGVIVPNDYKMFYDYFKLDSTSPKDVYDVLYSAEKEEIVVNINSPGGVIDSGTEIYTMLKKHEGKVNINIVGEACSSASMIAMAGDNVEMAPTALFMIHCVSRSGSGNAQDFEHLADMLKTADEAIATAYVNKTGLSKNKILDLMQKETWLNAEQAKEYGFIDKIMFVDENNTNFELTASNFKLPSMAEMQKIKSMIEKQDLDNKAAFFMSKIKFLKLKGV